MLVGIAVKKIAVWLLIASCLLLLLAMLIEFGTRVYLNTHPPYTVRDYLLTHPPAYADAPYFGPEFIAEIVDNHIRWTLSEDCNCFTPSDMSGHWYNVRGGLRVTPDSPAYADCSIYIVGDSSVWGSFLPDDRTLASYLQRLTPTCRVVNVGMIDGGTTQNLARLRTIQIKPHDAVIFYAGLIDVRAIYFSELKKDRAASACERLPRRFNQTAIVELLCRWQGSQPPQILRDAPRLSSVVREVAQRYRRNVDAARQYARQHGAAFYNILQPHLWSKPLSDTDHGLENADEFVPGMGDLISAAWPTLQRADPATIDFTHIVDPLRADGQAIYFDCCHVNEKANALIAQAIWQYIGDF